MSVATAAWKRVPWKKVWAGAVWLTVKGRERMNANLTEAEQHELRQLVTKSKGLPGNLRQRDKTRLKNLVRKAARGS